MVINKYTKSKVVVVVAVHNGANWIQEQLDSILKQTSIDLSVCISIDSSSDGSEILCNQFWQQNKNIVTLLSKGVFGSASRNFFRLLREVDLSGIDYIALSDQDDIWQPDKLSYSIQMIKQHNVDAYSGNVTAFWPNNSQKLINKAQPQQSWDYMFESAGPGCTFVLTKKLGLELQQFLIANQSGCKDITLHDWFIYAFARSRGFKWFIDPMPHMLYRQHAHNVIGANVGFKAKLVRWGKLREGWLINQSLFIANLLGYADAWPMRKLQSYHFLDRLALIANNKNLRRRLLDRIALIVFLLLPLKK